MRGYRGGDWVQTPSRDLGKSLRKAKLMNKQQQR